jgi:hypothetical protein
MMQRKYLVIFEQVQVNYNRFWQEYFDWLKLKGAGGLWKIVEGKTRRPVLFPSGVFKTNIT